MERCVATPVPDGEGLMYIARMLAAILLHKALEKGFNASIVAVVPWCAEVRARASQLFARQAFVDAGGERLLGITRPIP